MIKLNAKPVKKKGILDFVSYYRKVIKQPMLYPRIGKNLSYPILGIVGEFGEFKDLCYTYLSKKLVNGNVYFVNSIPEYQYLDMAVKEMGDIYWYTAIFCKEAKIDPKIILDGINIKNGVYEGIVNEFPLKGRDFIIEKMNFLIETEKDIFKLVENVKKIERDNKGNLPTDKKALIKNVVRILFYLKCFLSFNLPYCVSFNDIFQTNIKKLESRIKRNKLKGSGDER